MANLQSKLAGQTAHLSGVLDENAQLTQLDALGAFTHINFKDITRINSCGVRDWVQWMQTRAGKPTTYEACPLVIVKQLNSVPEFAKGATISSFFAPYFCEACDEERMILLDPTTIVEKKAPSIACSTCKAPLKFDAIANQYFGFLQRP